MSSLRKQLEYAELASSERYLIVPEQKSVVHGSPVLQGSKNSGMPIIVAAALSGRARVANAPGISDVAVLLEIIRSFGGEVVVTDNDISVELDEVTNTRIPGRLSERFRGAIYAAAIPFAKHGEVHFDQIGGDRLPSRSLEPHLRVFEGFGGTVQRTAEGFLIMARTLTPGRVFVGDRVAGVTATCLSMLIAATIDGTSRLYGTTREVEVFDVARILTQLGAQVLINDDFIEVTGKLAVRDGEILVVPDDHIHAGTLCIAAAITGGEIRLDSSVCNRLGAFLNALASAGVRISQHDGLTTVGGIPTSGMHIQTGPYPGVQSDLQPQLSALACVCTKPSSITENIYEVRSDHVFELRRMGARILADGSRVSIAPATLKGARVTGKGIRETAALLLAALAARGESTILSVDALYRGYVNLPAQLADLGAIVIVQHVGRAHE